MADILRTIEILRLIADIACKSRSGKHTAKNIHHHGEAGAFRAAYRQDHSLKCLGRIGGRLPFGIQSVAFRYGVAPSQGLTNLAARRDRRGHIQHEWPESPTWSADRQRACSENWLASSPWGHGSRGICEDHSDQSRLDGLQRITRGHAKMGATSHASDTDAVVSGDGDGFAHGACCHNLTKTVLAIHRNRHRRNLSQHDFRTWVDQASPYAIEIAR